MFSKLCAISGHIAPTMSESSWFYAEKRVPGNAGSEGGEPAA